MENNPQERDNTAFWWGLAFLIFLPLLLMLLGTQNGSESEGGVTSAEVEDAAASAAAAVAAAEAVAKGGSSGAPIPLKDKVVGYWLGSKSGGADGNTDCDAASFNPRFIQNQGNILGVVQYYPNGTYRQAVFTEEKKFVTDGEWQARGNTVRLTIEEAGIGEDLENLEPVPDVIGTDVPLSIRFDGPNVMYQTNLESRTTTRLVRCKE